MTKLSRRSVLRSSLALAAAGTLARPYIANAAATMVGQALGARKPERAENAVKIAGKYNMMVLTAIGVFAGTFLSWPVALLTTIAFFIAGQLAFGFLIDFTRQAILGGGPFESLIRLLSHDNQMSDLAPTASVILAKTLDSLVMPLMSMMVFVVPNFNALDVTNLVADGFADRLLQARMVVGDDKLDPEQAALLEC